VTVFLAGSIENDTAEKWQSTVINELSDEEVPITVFNPRREDWDPTWSGDRHPQLIEQINWELDHIERADIVFFYFDPKTKSPISLMELGFMLGYAAEHIVVVCPPGFWRRANVLVMCERANVEVLESLDSGLDELYMRIQHLLFSRRH